MSEKTREHISSLMDGEISRSALFLPYWLMNAEELISMFIDATEFSAHNQTLVFQDAVVTEKKRTLNEGGHNEVLSTFTVDSPVPFSLENVVYRIKALNEQMVQGSRGPKKGDFNGQFSRLLARIGAKLNDRRYGFLFHDDHGLHTYEAFHVLASKLMDFIAERGRARVKVIDFSEVPADVLPVVLGIVARLTYYFQFWMPAETRHPVAIVCDEAHLYLPRERGNPNQKRAQDQLLIDRQRLKMQQDSQIQTITKQFEFDGHQMTAITYKGKPAVIAKEFGQRLGYSKDGGKLVSLISDEWKSFFEDGKHYVVLRGKELSDFKELLKDNPSHGVSFHARIMLLFKSGMYKVAFKSGKPEAEPLIDFVVDHIFPQLEADGRYLPERTVNADGKLTWRDGVDREFEIRERDLTLREREFKMNVADRTLRLREEKERRLQDSKKGKALRLGAKYRLKLGRITEGQYHAICLKACEIEVGGRIGTDDSDLKQIDGKLYSPTRAADGKLYSPTRAAAILGVSVHAVGLAVSRIEKRLGISDIRKDERYVSPQAHMVQFTDGSTIHPDGYLMRENLFQMVKEKLKGRGPTSEQMKLSFN